MNSKNSFNKYRCWDNPDHRRILIHNEIYFASPRDFNYPLMAHTSACGRVGTILLFILSLSISNIFHMNPNLKDAWATSD